MKRLIRFFLQLVSISAVLYGVGKYFPEFGFEVVVQGGDLWGYLITGVVFRFSYFVLRRLIRFLSLPIARLTLGLSSIIINIAMFYLFAGLINVYISGIGVVIGGIWQTFLLSFLVSILTNVSGFILRKTL